MRQLLSIGSPNNGNREGIRGGLSSKMDKTLARFWAKVDKTDSCWNWNGNKKDGYGLCIINGKVQSAHRISYLIHNGYLPSALVICHSCDNPSCVNPNHLWAGTNQENTADRNKKKRQAIGERCHTKLTNEQVLQIRNHEGPQWKIAEKFNIHQTMVSAIKRKTKWAHLSL